MAAAESPSATLNLDGKRRIASSRRNDGSWRWQSRSLPARAVSAASGVPTFRGPDGLWAIRRPGTLATAEAFARYLKTVWEWYNWRWQVLEPKQPQPSTSGFGFMEPAVFRIHPVDSKMSMDCT